MIRAVSMSLPLVLVAACSSTQVQPVEAVATFMARYPPPTKKGK